MTDVATIKMKFLEDIGNAEFYVNRVEPTAGISAGRYKGYQQILQQVLLYLASANRGLTNIENNPDVGQRLSPDDLTTLKDKHREASRKYDEAYNSLHELDLDESLPDQQQAQISQVVDASGSTQTRK